MRTEIYIEDNKLDLYKDISAEFTYNIDDVKDFSARNTNFSKTIVIPGNATNNKLFGHIFEFGSANFHNPTADNVGYNFNAAKSASCVIYVDKIQMFKGVIRLLEIIVDNGSIEYECAVFGELGGLISAIGIRKLEDLDFSAYNHAWTRDNVVNSWDQASGTTASGMGYFYPLIDYGQVSHNNKLNFEIGAFRPALFVREYMKKIIEDAGYTWSSTFFDTNLFKRLVIPNNQKFLSNSSDIAFYGLFNVTNINGTYPGSPTARPLLPMGTVVNTGFFTLSNSNTRFTYTGAANISIKFSFNAVGNTDDNTTINIRKNGTTQTQLLIPEGDFNISAGETAYVNLVTNDYIEFQLDWDGYTASNSLDIFFDSFDVRFKTSAAQSVPLGLGETIIINNTIPRGIFQKDFFSSVIKMFNLYVTEDTNRGKHLKIEPYIDFYDFNNILNWTNKVDRSKPYRIKPMSELNGRYFEFKYKTDADFYNESYSKKYSEGYADYIEDTGFDFATDKQTAELIFASSPLVGYPGVDKIMTGIYKITNTQNTQSEDQIDSVIRIMQVRKITGVTSWHIKDTGGGNIGSSLTAYGYGGHLDDPDAPTSDINFGAPKEIFFTLVTDYPSANLFNGYWSEYIAEITDKNSKLLTCNIRLNDVDIYNLDFAKPIWIDGSLWRLNKVIDYNPMVDDTTKCEFLKVIEKSYT